MGEATLEVAVGKVQETNDRAAARLQLSWALPGDRTWTYPTTLRLRFVGNRWGVVLAPADVGLRQDEHLALTQQPAQRADILGAGGVAPGHRPAGAPVRHRQGAGPTGAAGRRSARALAQLLGIDARAVRRRR